MKKKKSKIPEFKSVKEEAKFWDTHSFADYWDELEDVDIVWEVDKPRDETLVLRVQKNFKENLKRAARKKGLNVSTLARMWLMEKLQTTKP
ncbi:MAG: CopG family antitoxin [Patescibacteria group bacterium]